MPIAIGIDLGTTNSVAAVATQTGVKLAVGPDGAPIHPSVVSFPNEGGVLVGPAARGRRANDPENTIYSAKRLIGQNIRAPLVQLAVSTMPFEVLEGPNQQPIVVARGRRMTIPEVSAMVLAYLKRVSEKQFGDEVTEAVITVPANFSDSQRKATKEAGTTAGLEVLRLVNEPTAAALAHGYGKGIKAVVAVFDFGGGTLDVSILKIDGEVFEVLATGGDFFLGGDDVDRALAEHLASDLNRTLGVDPRQSPEAMTRLNMAAEQIKCYLSTEDEASGEIEGLLVEGRDDPVTLPFQVTRQQFESMIAGYIDRTVEVCRHVVTSARLEPGQVDDVILVGGSTRIPLVRSRVAEYFGREPSGHINPDEVVAHGAAIQASMLSGQFAEVPADSPAVDTDMEPASPGGPDRSPPRALLLDVNPATLGVATAGGFADILLEKNAPIPIEHSKVFTTARDFQTRVVIECCRGEARRYDENEPLGTLVLDGLESGRRGETRVEVTFRIDTDGILNVRARDLRTGREQEATLNVLGAPVAGGGVEPIDLPAGDAP